MADDTTDTTPGSAPDVLRTGSDGSLPEDLGGRPAWVWMQDTSEGGGGRFDVLANRVDVWLRKGATVVPNYPIHVGPAGRTAKPLHQFAEPQPGGEAFIPRAGEPEGREPEAPPADTADTGGERQHDPAPAGADTNDQADGEPAAADTTTTTRKAGRTR